MSQANSNGAQTAPTLTNGYLNRTANQPLLGVRRKTWRADDDHSKILGPEFAGLRTEILQRDNYTCRFCGFKSAKYQEFHHVDADYDNCTKENLITACNLCHQIHHMAAIAMGSRGFFCTVQELTQTEINNIARAIYVNELIGNSDAVDKLTSLLASFKFRGSDTLKTIYNGDVITIQEFAEIFSDPNTISDELYANRASRISELRVYPSKNAFKDGQLEYYATNQRALFLPENWVALTRQLLG
uniref:HNH endonuclease n=1 Tax=Pseudomonas syringae TaxID=317 RepID=UPI001E2858FF|nr:HNH endonuclease [Pseudomonas syringae]QOQ33361.1 IcmJ (DotN) protein [Pseudomonas syringae pv. actinidiae]